ncbi:hypothetical protein [Gymnodinialimonas sp.]
MVRLGASNCGYCGARTPLINRRGVFISLPVLALVVLVVVSFVGIS